MFELQSWMNFSGMNPVNTGLSKKKKSPHSEKDKLPKVRQGNCICIAHFQHQVIHGVLDD